MVTLAAFAWGRAAPSAGTLPFGAVAACAVIAALALHDLNRGAPASRVAAGLVAVFALLFWLDFRNLPEKMLTPFGVESARFPESFRVAGQHWLTIGTLLAVLTVFLASWKPKTKVAKPFAPDDYMRGCARCAISGRQSTLRFCVIEALLASSRSLNSASACRISSASPLRAR